MTSTTEPTPDIELLTLMMGRTPFDDVTDPRHLRGAIDALDSLMEMLDLDDGSVLDEAGVDLPRVAGIRAAHVMARHHRQCAVARFAHLVRQRRSPHPVVLDPAVLTAPRRPSVQGQPLMPVITAGTAATSGLSSAQVWMPPGHTSLAHVHRHTGVGVVVLEGTAITLWWDVVGTLHELPQRAGQHLYIPPGVPHAALNPHDVPVVALEFRDNPVFTADNHLLPDLDPQVTTHRAPAPAA